MTVDLTHALSWKGASGDARIMLENLQANIVKGHVRTHVLLWFCRFSSGAALAAFLRGTRPLVKSAAAHLAETEAFKRSGAVGSTYVGIGLSRAGYDLLGLGADRRPADRSFNAGADQQAAALGGPSPSAWQVEFREPCHVMVLIGDHSRAAVDAMAARLRRRRGAAIVHVERGQGIVDRAGRAIEHFGFVDGLSQPLFLTEDVADAGLGAGDWNPAVPLGRAIAADRGVPGSTSHFGSYLVFEKLEQDVRAFATAVEALADSLQLTGVDRERAAAMIVGRFRDGTPLVSSGTALGPLGAGNGFGYAADPTGSRCPLHAHVRKMNARGTGGGPENAERAHLMARRGQTYGTRRDDPADPTVPAARRPTARVGLLFMAVNGDIADQFEFQQARWANRANFPAAPTNAGIEPVIGRGTPRTIHCPTTWGGAVTQAVAFPETVRLLGAGYFFLPSLAFLASPGAD